MATILVSLSFVAAVISSRDLLSANDNSDKNPGMSFLTDKETFRYLVNYIVSVSNCAKAANLYTHQPFHLKTVVYTKSFLTSY